MATARHVVRPYLEEEHAEVAGSAACEVVALNPERTFWEKATLLHALHHGTLTKPDKSADRLSRHLYDLHRLWRRPDVRALAEDGELLDAVVRNKEVFFKEGKARYELVRERQLAVRPHPALEAILRDDFEAMQSMFFPGSEVPSFDEALSTAGEIDAMVASWKRTGS